METYPIAGKLLEQKLLFRISILDLVDVFSIPFLFMGVTTFLGLPDLYSSWLGVFGLALSFVILIKTPPAQRPRHWILALLRYSLGTNTYLNRPTDRDRERGMVQDVVLTGKGDSGPPDDTSHRI